MSLCMVVTTLKSAPTHMRARESWMRKLDAMETPGPIPPGNIRKQMMIFLASLLRRRCDRLRSYFGITKQRDDFTY